MRLALFLISVVAIAGEFTTSLGDQYPYQVSAITTDAAGNTYVVGSRTRGGSFAKFYAGIAVPNPFGTTCGLTAFITGNFFNSGPDVFVTKLDSNGKVLFTNTFAGKGADTGTAIAVDPSGNIYIAGTTTSDDFPLSKALQTQPSSDYGGTAFIVKLSGDGTTILYSTYFGGTLGATSITSLATDAKGNLYLTGTTTSPDFPHTTGMPFGQLIPGTIELSLTGLATQQQSGAIIASISAAGDKILYSGALVGTTLPCSDSACSPMICATASACYPTGRTTTGVGIAVDASGNAYIAGNTNTIDLPTTTGAFAPKGVGAFAAKVNAGGTALSYLTYLDMAAGSMLSSLAVDAAGNAFLAGSTSDPKFPTTAGVFQPVFQASPSPNLCGVPTSAFLVKLNSSGSALTWSTFLGGAASAGPQSIAIDAGENVWATGTVSSGTFPNTNGWSTGTEFIAEVNASGTALPYSALYPTGTVARSVALDPSGLIHIAGRSGFVSAISPTGAPAMRIFDFQNAFGGDVTARISPAEVISIYGPGIGPATAVTATPSGGFYSKTLGGVQVTINGMNMPLLYVGANQINAVVPMGISTNTNAAIRVINGSQISPTYPVWTVDSAPQAFPTVFNQDGTVNSQSNPARSNSAVIFYGTGWQSSFSPLADGQVAATLQDACQKSCNVEADYVQDPTVLYGGAAPGIVAGVSQFNINVGKLNSEQGTVLSNFYFSDFSASITQSVWVKP